MLIGYREFERDRMLFSILSDPSILYGPKLNTNGEGKLDKLGVLLNHQLC
jgi:hypothetical protein